MQRSPEKKLWSDLLALNKPPHQTAVLRLSADSYTDKLTGDAVKTREPGIKGISVNTQIQKNT